MPCDPGDDSAIYLGEILDYILYGWVLTNQCVLVQEHGMRFIATGIGHQRVGWRWYGSGNKLVVSVVVVEVRLR